MASVLPPIVAVPVKAGLAKGAKVVRLLVVRKLPILEFSAKVAPEPVARLRETRLDCNVVSVLDALVAEVEAFPA